MTLKDTAQALTLADLKIERPDIFGGGTIPGAVLARLLTAQPENASFIPDPHVIALYMRGLAALLGAASEINENGAYLAHSLLREWARYLDPLVTDPEKFARQFSVEVTR
jgi:hypothetical protein